MDHQQRKNENSPDHIMQFFEIGEAPEEMAVIMRPFNILAEQIASAIPRNPERTVALRKLLESRDCALRARFAQ